MGKANALLIPGRKLSEWKLNRQTYFLSYISVEWHLIWEEGRREWSSVKHHTLAFLIKCSWIFLSGYFFTYYLSLGPLEEALNVLVFIIFTSFTGKHVSGTSCIVLPEADPFKIDFVFK